VTALARDLDKSRRGWGGQDGRSRRPVHAL